MLTWCSSSFQTCSMSWVTVFSAVVIFRLSSSIGDFLENFLTNAYLSLFEYTPNTQNAFSMLLTRSLRKTRILVFGNCYLPAENENFLFAVAFFNGASFSILFYLKSTLTAYQTEFESFPYCFVFKAAK